MNRSARRQHLIAATRFRIPRYVVLATVLGASLLACPAHAQPPGGERIAIVRVEPVERDSVSSYARFVATVVPTRRSVVGTAVDGRVERFLFDPTDEDRKLTYVTAGQELAQLKTDTVQREVNVAEAELRLREAELEELQNGTRAEELAAAKANLDGSAARREYAASRYARLEILFKSNSAVSRDQLEEAKSLVDQAEQANREAQAQYELLVAGPRPEAIAQARARRDSQEETVERLRGILKKYTVVAPFDGVVVNEFTELGAWVTQGDPVAEVIQIHPVEVETFLPEDLFPEIAIGTAAQVELPVRPSQPFVGKIHRIVRQADVRSRTFPVRIRLDEDVDALQDNIVAGMLGHVQPELPSAASVLLVHKDALVLDRQRKHVVVIDPAEGETYNGIARAVPVTLGIERGNRIQIRGDLQPGQLVVTLGNERLRDGQKVKYQQHASN